MVVEVQPPRKPMAHGEACSPLSCAPQGERREVNIIRSNNAVLFIN
jgi:hypothetical protein